MADSSADSVAIVGLGYVGLPLALAFGRARITIGYERAADKVAAYRPDTTRRERSTRRRSGRPGTSRSPTTRPP